MKNKVILIQSMLITGLLIGIIAHKLQKPQPTKDTRVAAYMTASNELRRLVIDQAARINLLNSKISLLRSEKQALTNKPQPKPQPEERYVVVDDVNERISRPRAGRMGRMGLQ